jgi:hypothetical protein
MLYASIVLTPNGTEIPIAGHSSGIQHASELQLMSAEGLFAAYVCLEMMAFIGFAASKLMTLLQLFTITVGLDWDDLFLLRAHM